MRRAAVPPAPPDVDRNPGAWEGYVGLAPQSRQKTAVQPIASAGLVQGSPQSDFDSGVAPPLTTKPCAPAR
jgi:hypothetical protein